MPEHSSSSSGSFFAKHQFWLIFLAAALVVELPLISIPLKWFESYFHEISHGLAAIVTGGEIVRIQLFPNGAGLCTTRGGSPFLISFMGYAGAAIFGCFIYWFASLHQRIAQLFSVVIALFLLTTLVFWLKDLLSFIIIIVLLAVILLKFKLSNVQYFQWLLQLIGATVLLNSVKSPWYLVDGRSLGDGAALAQQTGIPEIVWVAIWFGIGVLAIFLLAKRKT